MSEPNQKSSDKPHLELLGQVRKAVPMSEPPVEQKFRRAALGADPATCHATRRGYPEWVFDTLRERCGLALGTAAYSAT
jgi:hypothetical protein